MYPRNDFYENKSYSLLFTFVHIIPGVVGAKYGGGLGHLTAKNYYVVRPNNLYTVICLL